MDDQQIIALYLARSERAIAETDARHGPYCRAIARRILQSPEDSEECVNDTWLRAWNAIPPQRPKRLAVFLGRITRNLALDRWEAQHTQKRGGGQVCLALEELAQCLPAPGEGDMTETLALVQALDRFLSGLPRQARLLFLRRYWYLDSVEEAARQLGLGESAAKMSLARSRRKLKAVLEKEGITL